jgi:hypothetical protein
MKTFKSPPIHRTPLYRAKAAYCNMIARCENANGKNPSYVDVKLRMTLDEYLEWAVPRYAQFIAQFPNETPCTARIGDKGDREHRGCFPQRECATFSTRCASEERARYFVVVSLL